MHNPLCLKWLAIPVVLLLAPSAASETPVGESIRTWAAPPFWAPASPPPEAAETAGREALAAGRQSLVPGPVALPFIALPPCRLVDTRGNAPLTGGFLPAGTVRSYTLTGACGIPANARAVSLNATVVRPTGPGFLVLWAQGAVFPPVSTLNYLGGDVISNAALVPLSTTGGLSMALGVSGGDVILDTNGYYAPAGVSSVNALSGDLTLAAGSNLTLSQLGNTLTLATAPSLTANLTGNVTGNVTGAATSFTGPLGGNVTGTQGATVVSTVGGQPAANVAAGAVLASAATATNTPNTIVKRDASGNFSANVVTAAGGYQQPGTGGEILKIVRGEFACPGGQIIVGSGFTPTRIGVGVYVVTYATQFAGAAVVTATPFNNFASYAVIGQYSGSQFTVYTYNAAGTPTDLPGINFIAVGPPPYW